MFTKSTKRKLAMDTGSQLDRFTSSVSVRLAEMGQTLRGHIVESVRRTDIRISSLEESLTRLDAVSEVFRSELRMLSKEVEELRCDVECGGYTKVEDVEKECSFG